MSLFRQYDCSEGSILCSVLGHQYNKSWLAFTMLLLALEDVSGFILEIFSLGDLGAVFPHSKFLSFSLFSILSCCWNETTHNMEELGATLYSLFCLSISLPIMKSASRPSDLVVQVLLFLWSWPVIFSLLLFGFWKIARIQICIHWFVKIKCQFLMRVIKSKLLKRFHFQASTS